MTPQDLCDEVRVRVRVRARVTVRVRVRVNNGEVRVRAGVNNGDVRLISLLRVHGGGQSGVRLLINYAKLNAF